MLNRLEYRISFISGSQPISIISSGSNLPHLCPASDLNIEQIPAQGVGAEYSVEIGDGCIVIRFDEDYEKTWVKRTYYRIHCESEPDWIQRKNPKTSVEVESVWERGFERDVHLPTLETCRANEVRRLIAQSVP